MAERPPAAVVGMACVLPGAPDLGRYWANLVAGYDAIGDVPPDRWDPVYYDPEARSPDRFYCRRGGFVDGVAAFDPTRFGIMPRAVEGAEPDQLLALAVAARALADAGDPQRALAPDRVGVILGRGGYIGSSTHRLGQRVGTAEQLVVALGNLLPDLGAEQLAAVKADFVERLGPMSPESAIDLVPNLTASRIANRLDLRGPAHTVDAACASSLVAVDQALDQLATGRCDVMLAGGVHHCHDLTLWSVFTQLGAVSRDQQIRPFDRRADGLLIGEGTAVVVLKRLADAEAAGDRVYAVLRGLGVSSDGRATSLMSPTVDGQVRAVERAWQEAGRDPAAVGMVEAHGTGTPTGDEIELQTLRAVFGPARPDRAPAGLGSVKSMIGHAMPAAGAASLVKAALAIYHGQRPPTLHVEEPAPGVAATAFRLLGECEPWDDPGPRVAGVDAFGFGGINAHAVLEEHLPSTGRRAGRGRGRAGSAAARVTAPAAAGVDDGERILTVAGATPAEVAAHLAGLGDPEALVAAGATRRAVGDGRCRLAVVAPTAKKLKLAAAVAERGRPFSGRNDVWFQPEPLAGPDGGGQVAYLFPGLEPDFAPRLDDIAAWDGFDGRRIVGDDSRLEVLGPAVVDAGRLLYRALDRLGVRPDLAAGHSVGEWAAQAALGMVPDTAVEHLAGSLQPGRIRHPDVAYLTLGCPLDAARALIDGIDDVVVSHDNCPHQTVVCGADAPVAAVADRARRSKVLAQELSFRSGFHTPMFAPYVDGLREFWSVAAGRPAVPLWSATTCAPYPDDPDEVRALNVEHLVRPVEFRRLTERMWEAGARVFVQVGVGSLDGFVCDTLGDRPHLKVATNNPRRSGMAQLRRAAVALWSAGVAVDFDGCASPAVAVSGRDGVGAAEAVASAGAADAPVGPATQPLRFAARLVRDLAPLVLPAPAAASVGAVASPAAGAASPAASAAVGAASPVVAAFNAALDEAAGAATAVLERWAARPRAGGGPGTEVPAAPPGGAERAGLGRAARPRGVDRQETFSLDAEPAWADHAIFNQAEGWPSPEDRFPIVPLTAMIERFVRLGEEVCPGKVAVAVEDVRATRWLVVAPPTTARVQATVIGTDGPTVRVRTSIDGHVRATVVMADRYPPAPAPETTPPFPCRLPYPTDDIYGQRWLFHGPAYQGINQITGWGDAGIEGAVTCLAAPGALLDNAGQVLGLWVALALDDRRTVLPTTIDRISFYSAQPVPGAAVTCRADVTGVEQERVVADLRLVGPDGPWATVAGWTERRFDMTNRTFEVIRAPHDHAVAEVAAGGWAWVRETWLDPASREMVMRRYLAGEERRAYEARNPRAQRATLAGRIALKDLLRLRRWAAGGGPLFPAEITVTNDAAGRPVVTGAVDEGVHVSIAHSGGVAVAIADPTGPAGIDVEAVTPRSRDIVPTLIADAERTLFDTLAGSFEERLTTFWALKEAAAKAAGTGLEGRPKAFVVAEARDGRFRIGERWLAVDRLVVPPDQKEYVVAWTLPHH